MLEPIAFDFEQDMFYVRQSKAGTDNADETSCETQLALRNHVARLFGGREICLYEEETDTSE